MLEEEMREIDECDMEEFDTLDSSEKTIVILGDRWWRQAGKQEGDKSSICFLCKCMGTPSWAPNCWRCLY